MLVREAQEVVREAANNVEGCASREVVTLRKSVARCWCRRQQTLLASE